LELFCGFFLEVELEVRAPALLELNWDLIVLAPIPAVLTSENATKRVNAL
jgi:hypothetical protein